MKKTVDRQKHTSAVSMWKLPTSSHCLTGTTLDPSLIRDACEGRVHSTFQSAVNVELPGPEVLSLVVDRDALTVMGVLVDEGFGDLRAHFEAGQPVRVEAGMLETPAVSIRLNQAPWPFPSAEGIGRPAALETCRQRVARLLETCRGLELEGSLLGAFARIRRRSPLDKEVDPLSRTMEISLNRLADAIDDGDPVILAPAAASMVGLGPGLTPAGDDLLCGLLLAQAYGARVSGGPEANPEMTALVLEAACNMTHLLSRVMLERAARGVTTVGVDRLLCAIVAEDPPCPVDLAAPPVIEIGATSGLDLIAGIVLAWAPFVCRG